MYYKKNKNKKNTIKYIKNQSNYILRLQQILQFFFNIKKNMQIQ
jgi:hypothetical protein